jgi:hypothetical protein
MTYPTAVRNAEERSSVPCHGRGEVENKRMMWSSAEIGSADWTMQTSSGQSCIGGLRHARVTIDTAKLISPSQSGQNCWARSKLIIQLVKIVIGLAFSAYGGCRLHAATNVGADKDGEKRQRALEVLNRLPPQ